MILTAFCLCVLLQQGPGDESAWAVKQVHVGQSPAGLPRGLAGRPALDIDRDGYDDVFLDDGREWFAYPSDWNSLWGRFTGRGMRLLNVRKVPEAEFYSEMPVILNRRGAFEVVIDRTHHPISIEAERLSFPSGERIGFIPTPPQPPGIEAMNPIRRMVHVGDLDGDGYDDALGWNYARRVDVDPAVLQFAYSRLDGATMEVAWTTRFDRVSGGFALWEKAMQLFDDVDHDGVKDLLVQIYYADPAPRNAIAALSGADGHVIWEIGDIPGPASTSLTVGTVADQSGDGARDVVAYRSPMAWPPGPDPGFLAVLASDSGQPIWQRTLASDFPWWPSTLWLRVNLRTMMGEVGDLDGDLVPDLCFAVVVQPTQGQNEYRIWTYSGADGGLILREPWPSLFEPWFDGPFPPAVADAFPQNIGDADGDGWSDFASPMQSEGVPLGTAHFTVYGRRTLVLPDAAALGERIKGKLWIPKGAGMEYQLLVSSVFERDGDGIHVGVWDTHLGGSSLIPWSKTQAGSRGVLDASGRASFEVRAPGFAHLRGKDIYVVAVIKNPAQPDGVQTLSTIETITLD